MRTHSSFQHDFRHQKWLQPLLGKRKQLLNQEQKRGLLSKPTWLGWPCALRHCWCRRRTTAPAPTPMTTTSWALQKMAPPVPCTGKAAWCGSAAARGRSSTLTNARAQRSQRIGMQGLRRICRNPSLARRFFSSSQVRPRPTVRTTRGTWILAIIWPTSTAAASVVSLGLSVHQQCGRNRHSGERYCPGRLAPQPTYPNLEVKTSLNNGMLGAQPYAFAFDAALREP